MSQQAHTSKHTEPEAGRPTMPVGYGVPEGTAGVLPWSWLDTRLSAARNYWVGTTRPDGRPHAMPVWGVWVEGRLYFGTDPQSRKGRNLSTNPAVVVHLESGDEVVIVEGVAEETPDNPALHARIEEAYHAKYKTRDVGNYVVRPRVVFAWSQFPADVTRWQFSDD